MRQWWLPRLALLALLTALLAFGGCGGGEDDSASNREGAYKAVEDVEVPNDYTAEVKVAEEAPKNGGPLTAVAEEDSDYAEYEASVEDLVAYLDAFWEDVFQNEAGESYGPPSDIYGYYPEED